MYEQTKLKPVQTLLDSLTFEKTALYGKSTFQPPVNVEEFGLRYVLSASRALVHYRNLLSA
jgi:hypothetical protein